MIDINAKKENCLARDKEFLSIYNDAFNFMIEKIPPKGVSFSDLICIFAMSVGFDTYFDLQH